MQTCCVSFCDREFLCNLARRCKQRLYDMTEKPIEARRFLVRGRVQGVGFRWFVEREAHILGIAGWVRNNHDGSVEVLAQGTRDQLSGSAWPPARGATRGPGGCGRSIRSPAGRRTQFISH